MPARKPPADREIRGRTQLKNRPNLNWRRGQKIHLCDLPIEVLDRIVAKVPVWQRAGIRSTCGHLRNVCNSVLLHEFKAELQKHVRRGIFCYEYAALTVIHQSTWAYVKAGYCPLFVGTMSSVLKDPFNPTLEEVNECLMKFYELVEKDLQDPNGHTSRILYAVTILGFMQNCRNSSLVSSCDVGLDHWQAVFEFRGSWMGLLRTSRPTRSFIHRFHSTDRNELLVLLAELMFSMNSETAFSKVWETENQEYVFGHQIKEKTHLPRTVFTFDVHGTTQVLSFFKNAASKNNWSRLPKDDFKLSLKIFCKEARKWGCFQSYEVDVSSNPEV